MLTLDECRYFDVGKILREEQCTCDKVCDVMQIVSVQIHWLARGVAKRKRGFAKLFECGMEMTSKLWKVQIEMCRSRKKYKVAEI